jgi:hypothetical protein
LLWRDLGQQLAAEVLISPVERWISTSTARRTW